MGANKIRGSSFASLQLTLPGYNSTVNAKELQMMKLISEFFGMAMDLFLTAVVGMMVLGYDVVGFAAQLVAFFVGK